jgi:hypothetical protein
MRKSVILIFFVLFFIFCSTDSDVVERTEEDGVEVIKNHLEPYELNEPNNFNSEILFYIDTASTLITKTGLLDISDFDVDSKGNIYCISTKNLEHLVFKFGKNGKFLDSFIRKGRGPGEVDRLANFRINHRDEIEIYKPHPPTLLFFDGNGELIREKRFKRSHTKALALKNGNYLVLGPPEHFDENFVYTPLSMLDSNLEKIKELEIRKLPNPVDAKKMKYSSHVFQWSLSKEHLFIANEHRGYEIPVFDFDGNLIRKIQKEYHPVAIPSEVKVRFKKVYTRFADKIYFPKNYDPFQGIFTDDQGRLFVATYEQGENPGEYIHDIFNAEGVFIGRKSLNHFATAKDSAPSALEAKLKNNRLYCLQMDDMGYMRIAVSEIRWK